MLYFQKYSTQFCQTFSHLQAKNLHLQASYALDTEWFAMQFRFVEQPTSGEFEAIEINFEAMLAEENTTKEAFLQEIQYNKKIIFYDIETLYIFNSPTLERWIPEHAMQDARDVLGIMFNSLTNYPQTI
ncbi:MAG: hypothetical protein EAZ95_03190 [Bacteroidetes bacterium]|nr:MAG: hypothetical protein EAZ95_03190 [Bacteroidota bacterium]